MLFKPSDRFDYRQTVYLTILACYLLPILIYSKYSIGLMSVQKSWGVLSIGLVISMLGSAGLILLIRSWELTLRHQLATAAPVYLNGSSIPDTIPIVGDAEKITPLHPEYHHPDTANLESSLADSHRNQEQLSEELRSAMHQLRQISEEKESLSRQLTQVSREYEEYKNSVSGHLKEKDSASSTLEKALVEQKATLEQKQHLITKLENKVQDLNYEVKTLLQLGDMASAQGSLPNATRDNVHPVLDGLNNEGEAMDVATLYQTMPTSSDKQVRSPYDATLQLQHCIELSQNLEGAAHLGNGNNRFSELSVDSQALDLRRLADRFRSEISAPVLLYSPTEDKLLFASNQIQGLFGWSADKVVGDFYNLVQGGRDEWYKALEALNEQDEVQLRLVVKAKSGQDIMVYCHLGPIRSGVFANHAIAVLYPAT